MLSFGFCTWICIEAEFGCIHRLGGLDRALKGKEDEDAMEVECMFLVETISKK